MKAFKTILVILIVGGIGYGIFYWYQWNQKYGVRSGYLNLKEFNGELYDYVRNGGDLEAFQSLIKILSKEKYPLKVINSGSKDNYFIRAVNIPTEEILLSMKGLYLARTSKDNLDSSVVININKLIQEYRFLNPFGVLDEGQQYYFENIRKKLGDDYSEIELDVIQLVKELKEKNSIVNEYLANSKESLENSETSLGRSGFAIFISICSLLIAIIVNIPILIQKIKNIKIINESE